MQNKRVFVSGGAGAVGKILVPRLMEAGAYVFVGDLKPCPIPWLGKVKYWQGNLNTISAQELFNFDPEIFFHLASSFKRNEEEGSFFDENFENNLRLSHTLSHHMANIRSLKRVIFASSYQVYDSSLYLFTQPPQQASLLSENAPTFPRNLYGAAKLFHEAELHFLNHFLEGKVSCISARLFSLYGCHYPSLISHWIQLILRKEPITIYHPEEMFDFLFTEDAAEGLLRLAQIDDQGIVNLGMGQVRTKGEVIKILKKHFPELQVNYQHSHLPIEAAQANIDRLISLTQWRPLHQLETAIPEIIEFEKRALKEHLIERHPAVLITSISKKMPLIEAVRTAANKIGHFQKIHGCDSHAFCIGQYGVDKFWHCPPLDELNIEEVVNYCKANRITAIIPTRNADLEFYAPHLALFHKQGIFLMASSLETILSCLDKKAFADVLQQYGFPAISTYFSLEDFESSFYVVKERRGAGSQQLGLRLTRLEALEHSRKLKDPIFQPFIEGQEWSVDIYRSFEGKVKGCVARQRNDIVNGESQVTTTASYPALEMLCIKIADFLEIKGHAVFQLIEEEKGIFHVIECNPRFGGASTVSLAVGLDSFFWFFAECLGLSLHHYPFMRCKGEIRQVRYLADRLLPWSSYLT